MSDIGDVIRDATIPFFQNRSDTENSRDRLLLMQSDTSALFFIKKKLM